MSDGRPLTFDMVTGETERMLFVHDCVGDNDDLDEVADDYEPADWESSDPTVR
jgi:hypothetical protein